MSYRVNRELPLSLTVLVSFFLHTVFFISLVMPQVNVLLDRAALRKKIASAGSGVQGRDIIANINQDDQRRIDDRTLLSDRDSKAKGFITTKRGDRWLNNSLDFQVLKGSNDRPSSGSTSDNSQKMKYLLDDNSKLSMLIDRNPRKNHPGRGSAGVAERVAIPDKYGVTRENAIFYSSEGKFSFNTAKFKNFHYFKKMKDRIASNWHPPMMANAVMAGYDPITGTYTPGYTRIMAIPPQEVKLYFIMDRDGNVEDIQLLDSMGNRPLDMSCIDAIRLSQTFGKVPDDIPGKHIVINFIFGYYVY